MRFLSVCSGIEAASVAWSSLGWKAHAFSEIEAFPSAVLAHHYPDTPNWGDMTNFKEWPDAAFDVLCGGTPCQSFSNAGLRAGLDDPRGDLMLTFGAIAARYRPRWLVWENVPGVLSSNGGRDFGTFLGLLGLIGYGFAYRVLDAQYIRVDGYGRAVPQRRKRVFVVGCFGDWRRAAAVLLERESMRGDLAPRRRSRQDVAARALCSSDGGIDREDRHTLIAPTVAACLTRGAESSGKGGYAGRRQEDDTNLVAGTLTANNGPNQHGFGGFACNQAVDSNHLVAYGGNNTSGPIEVATACNAHGGPSGRMDFESETFVAHTLRGDGFDASEDGTGRGTPLVAVGCDVFNGLETGEFAATLGANSGQSANHSGPSVMTYVPEIHPTMVARSSRGGGQTNSPGHNADETLIACDTTQLTSAANRSNPQPGDPCHPLVAGGHAPAIAFDARQSDVIQYGDKAGPLDTDGHTIGVAYSTKLHNTKSNGAGKCYEEYTAGLDHNSPPPALLTATAVRRLMPVECERLMGFPDGYTNITWRGKPAADGPRYKALGNSWAVNCARWVGRRIALVESIK